MQAVLANGDAEEIAVLARRMWQEPGDERQTPLDLIMEAVQTAIDDTEQEQP